MRKLDAPVWTAHEIKLLRQLYPYGSWQELYEALNRSRQAISTRAHRLGIKRSTCGRGILWTEAEIALLRIRYALSTASELTRLFNRPSYAITAKARALGLSKQGNPSHEVYMLKMPGALNEQLAYFVGYIVADGCIHDEGVSFSASAKDKDHLERLLALLGSTHPISQAHGRYGDWLRVHVTRRELAQWFIDLGVTKHKSLTCQMPAIPDELFWHFLRGYFDGDGAIRYARRAGLVMKFTSGSPTLLQQISCRIKSELNISTRVTHDKGRPTANRLYYSGPNALRIAAAMYLDADSLYLERKKSVFGAYENRNTTK